MGEPIDPLHPVTNDVTPEELVEQSDALTEHIHANGSGEVPAITPLDALAKIVDEHQTIIERQRATDQRQRWIFAAIGILAVVSLVFGVSSLLLTRRVDHNSRTAVEAKAAALVTNAAIKIYCEQTNVDNAEAAKQFVARFGPTTPADQQTDLADFTKVLFPQRDCNVNAQATTP